MSGTENLTSRLRGRLCTQLYFKRGDTDNYNKLYYFLTQGLGYIAHCGTKNDCTAGKISAKFTFTLPKCKASLTAKEQVMCCNSICLDRQCLSKIIGLGGVPMYTITNFKSKHTYRTTV